MHRTPAKLASLRRQLIRFVRAERGTIAVMSGVIGIASLGALAVAVDSGAVYFERRRAQGAVDLAAIAAARDLPRARAAAEATVADHRIPGVERLALGVGHYSPDPKRAPTSRFVQGALPANAVRVELHSRAPLYFGRAMARDGSYAVVTRATAVNSAVAAFSVGSRLLSLNGGILNAVLGRLLGGNLSLSVMDYNSLAGFNVDLFRFSDALSARVSGRIGTYDELSDSKASVGQVIDALSDVARDDAGGSSAALALKTLGANTDARSLSLPVGQLLDFGSHGQVAIGEGGSAFAVKASALSILATAAQIANGTRQVEVTANLGLPGLAALSVGITIGERPQSSPWIGLGEKDVRVYTAQTRIRMTAEVGGAGLLAGAKLRLPVYVDLASAEARLQGITCGPDPSRDARVDIGVTPAVVDAWIAEPTHPKDWTSFRKKPSMVPAKLMDALGSVEAKGQAHAAITNLREQSVSFNWADISELRPKTVRTTDYTASLVHSLLGDLDLEIKAGPLVVATPALLGKTLVGTLYPVAKTLDGVLDSLLGILGVRIGEADVWVHGVRCDGAVLVN